MNSTSANFWTTVLGVIVVLAIAWTIWFYGFANDTPGIPNTGVAATTTY